MSVPRKSLQDLGGLLWRYDGTEEVTISVRGEPLCTIRIDEIQTSELEGVLDDLREFRNDISSVMSGVRNRLADKIEQVQEKMEELGGQP